MKKLGDFPPKENAEDFANKNTKKSSFFYYHKNNALFINKK